MRTGFRRLAWWRWVLAVVCAGFVGVWVFSEFKWFDLYEVVFPAANSDRPSALCIRGRLVVISNLWDFSDGTEPTLFYKLVSSRERWWFDLHLRRGGLYLSRGGWLHGPGIWSLSIPLWIPGALLAALTAFSWHSALRERRRLAMTHCVQCGYDRHGLPDNTVCPECGAGKDSRRGAEARG